MTAHATEGAGPDLSQGVTLADFGERQMLRGHVGKKAVLLARFGDEVVAVGAKCTHYQCPLDQGIIEGETVRCPLHHACFSLRTGGALGAPAFDPIPCWKVEHESGRIFVRERVESVASSLRALPDELERIVIVGGGAAGFSAAEMLRRKGYRGHLTMLSEDSDAPCDRPSLSKDYLARSIHLGSIRSNKQSDQQDISETDPEAAWSLKERPGRFSYEKKPRLEWSLKNDHRLVGSGTSLYLAQEISRPT